MFFWENYITREWSCTDNVEYIRNMAFNLVRKMHWRTLYCFYIISWCFHLQEIEMYIFWSETLVLPLVRHIPSISNLALLILLIHTISLPLTCHFLHRTFVVLCGIQSTMFLQYYKEQNNEILPSYLTYIY